MSALRRLSIVCAAALLLLQPSLLSAQDIKPPIRGLVSMGAYRFVGYGGDPVNTLEPLNAKPGIFGGLVVIASWKQLQPTPDAEIGPNNVVDRALAEVRAYNERNPQKPIAVKLRVWGGFEAPDWAKSLGGPPIETIFNEKPRTVGRFWSPAYRQAWAGLQQQLAARFDRRKSDPAVLSSPRFGELPSSGLSGFFGFRSVGKILITPNVITAARPTIAAMYTTRSSSPRASLKAAVE